LPDPSETLKIGVFDDVEKQGIRDGNETVYRVVDDLLFVGRMQNSYIC
jgi:hypothetical protein